MQEKAFLLKAKWYTLLWEQELVAIVVRFMLVAANTRTRYDDLSRATGLRLHRTSIEDSPSSIVPAKRLLTLGQQGFNATVVSVHHMQECTTERTRPIATYQDPTPEP